MKILLTNHHLADRAGSELYTKELSTALVQRGHQVAVFTCVDGAVGAEIRAAGIPVFSLGDGARIEAFDPDIVHVHHTPCLYFLTSLRVEAPAIFSSLGVLPALEAPPPLYPGIALGLAVSEEVKEALVSTPFGRSVQLRIFRNWFDDRGLTPPSAPRSRDVREVLVVTNHLDPSLSSMLDRIAATRCGFRWTHWGYPNRSVAVEPARLASYDAVITIGRTALLAGALGVPCLLFDVHGCDGWLDAPRLDELATRNFSGRLTRSRPSQAEFEHLLFEGGRQLDLQAVADRCWSSFSLSARCAELEGIYLLAATSQARLGAGTRDAFGRIGEAFRDSILTIGNTLELRHRGEKAELRAHAEDLRTALVKAQAQLEQRERELAQTAHDLAETAQVLNALESSFGVRLVHGAKRLPGIHGTYIRMKSMFLHKSLTGRGDDREEARRLDRGEPDRPRA